MELSALQGTRAWDAAPRWPPSADREGVELPTPALLGILAGALLVELLVYSAATRAALASVSPFGSGSDSVMRLLVVPSAIAMAVSLGLVLVLGWHRAAGLGPGRPSPWGVVPLGIFAVATLATLGIPTVAARGESFVGLVLAGLFLAAASEEILFRGFLHHGLTRRLGGRASVLIGSALFSAAHIPALIDTDVEAAAVPITLVVLFGFGALLCRIRADTGSIWYATGVHTLWNFVTVGVIGWAYSTAEVPGAFVALKLIPVGVGLVVAARLARGRFGAAPPPMPAGVVPLGLVPAAAPLPATAPITPGAAGALAFPAGPPPPRLPPPPRRDG
jgi:membrane protease YdiL (CAAX protease family)